MNKILWGEKEEEKCFDCGSENLEIAEVATRFFRGLHIKCLDCGQIVELDEPEDPAEHRSAER